MMIAQTDASGTRAPRDASRAQGTQRKQRTSLGLDDSWFKWPRPATQKPPPRTHQPPPSDAPPPALDDSLADGWFV